MELCLQHQEPSLQALLNSLQAEHSSTGVTGENDFSQERDKELHLWVVAHFVPTSTGKDNTSGEQLCS